MGHFNLHFYLYNKTIKRNNIITKLGYNLITIWESDFTKLEKTNKSIE
jgi:hypothetical protein